MKREAWLDANVVLRFLTADHPEMYDRSRALMAQAESGDVKLRLAPITVAEVVWTLDSFYGLSRQAIGEKLTQFVSAEGVEAEEKGVIIQALRDYREKNVDFADAYLARHAEHVGPARVFTFDLKHFSRLGVETLTPGEPASGASR